MTTRMTSTSTIAWRFTTLTSTSTECTHARIVSPSLNIHTHIDSSSSLVRTPSTCHPCERCLFDSTYSTFYFPAFFLSVFLFPFFHLSYEQQLELNMKIMENLCHSAANGSEDTFDVLYLSTPDVLASTASESTRKTRFKSQLPLSSWTEQHQRTGRFAKDA